ncbi:MAG: tRNA preQ1(34) S-adenosylmethionine ribosyltransferase-isomerase QueA [Candidatus Sumerlaeaceae bacterium]|nr:tRNA preQ1(34) S-adenosylmethionine ribosyltransferase-isomerase QueA [Candidatus Sumerlaeaceae bacterium]
MRTDLFEFSLPHELIAAVPTEMREGSRLMVLHRNKGSIEHRRFVEIGSYLKPGDLLVVNDSKVIRARIHGKRLETGGSVEMLLMERTGQSGLTDRWNVLCRPAKKLKPGQVVYFANKELTATVLHYTGEGEREVEFSAPDVMPWLDQIGEVPLPPYIIQRRREMGLADPLKPADMDDNSRYQTVYAREPGSIAAPTAGLHFSPELLASLEANGVQRAAVTLHVGLGTFKPVEVEEVEDHPMHTEHYEISEGTAAAINSAKAEGRRVIAVGTTAVRTLESSVAEDGSVRAGRFDTALMLTPGSNFRVVDAMVTNFHLPRSTLLMLVSAFAGREFILRAYAEAVREEYRFFSYGDAMLLL